MPIILRFLPGFALAVLVGQPAGAAEPPRLVLQITVDGLRGDLLERYASNLGDGGFRYLLDRGVVYTNAQYRHANTETIVGHTTLATGATPAKHGMVGNVWYNDETGELGYNIEDPEAPLLPTRVTQAAGAQVDPAQQRAQSQGRSPRAILVPTFGDTLSVAADGEARIFGLSGKDRSAVAMAGKRGIAYWYSTDTGDFQTSAYYMDDYPDWVRDWNRERRAEALSGASWSLMLEPDRYLFADQDDRPYEVDLRGYGRTFPHPFGPDDHPLFFTRVAVSPEGDRLLADFGKTLILEEAIGQDTVTDYLAISFSSVDAVNHFFGPSSLENEDVVLSLDRILADLFRFVDETVGLEHTVIVLSADHGMPEMPEYAAERGIETGRMFGDEVLQLARDASVALYDNAHVVRDFFRPYLYLDEGIISDLGLDADDVVVALASALDDEPGIGGAVPVLSTGDVGPNAHADAIRRNHHDRRSGDVYVYQAPYWFMFDRGPAAAMHGSPWEYDTHVNIVFAGPGITPATIDRMVHPIDVAPTLSALLGLPRPAGAEGQVLTEVVSE